MVEFQDRPVNLVKDDYAKTLYSTVASLPIIDYHCHLSPKEIYEDKVFSNIGEMWLAADHYKWRLMRSYGVDEYYITGAASYREKFDKFIETVSFAFGNPIQDWVALELEMFFGITCKLTKENAEYIWKTANKKIREESLSPRKLIAMSNVEYIATTDDPSDTLEYHKKLLKDPDFNVKVVPSFRVDNILLVDDDNYLDYIKKLGISADKDINNLQDLKDAIKKRMDYFVSLDCKFSDVGIQYFPTKIDSFENADETFKKVLKGEKISQDEYMGFLGYMYVYLGKCYKKRNMVMQLHLAVTRNSNDVMFAQCGKDSGFDCVGEVIDIKYIRNLFNALNNADSFPETIIYTLNPTMYYPLITLCGAFTNVHMGISWWFCDHKRGMFETLDMVSELLHITSIVGMLTDSRSFLSYVRHDYYRQIVCKYLSQFMKSENDQEVIKVAKALCYDNAKKLIEV